MYICVSIYAHMYLSRDIHTNIYIFRISTHTYIHMHTYNDKEAMNLRELEAWMGGGGGRKVKGKYDGIILSFKRTKGL